MKNKGFDYILLVILSLIIFLGIFALASAASVGSETRVLEQLVLGFIPGVLLGIVLFKTPLEIIQKWSPHALFANFFLLAMVFIPFIGITRGGATRWLELGPLSFQPAEFLKLTFVLYIASWLITKKEKEKKRDSTSFAKTLLPFLVVCVLIGSLLLAQRDLSTLGIILFTGFIVYFSGKTPLWHSIVLLLAGGGSFLLLIQMAPYRLSRITGFLNPEVDPLGITYHVRQALIAIGSGGIFGLGLGMSQQKFGFLPFPATDSVFAILAEEMGFVGAITLVVLFLAFFWRGFVIAKNNRSGFARLMSIGICSWIFIQAAINIGVVTGIFPVTGIPLPFISYGKSHLIAELAAMGILLNASRFARK